MLDEAITLDPRFALAHAARSRRLNSRGNSTGLDDYTAAVAAARTATSLDPQLARGHYALGTALSKLGQIDTVDAQQLAAPRRAVAAHADAIQRQPERRPADAMLGQHRAAGDSPGGAALR